MEHVVIKFALSYLVLCYQQQMPQNSVGVVLFLQKIPFRWCYSPLASTFCWFFSMQHPFIWCCFISLVLDSIPLVLCQFLQQIQYSVGMSSVDSIPLVLCYLLSSIALVVSSCSRKQNQINVRLMYMYSFHYHDYIGTWCYRQNPGYYVDKRMQQELPPIRAYICREK